MEFFDKLSESLVSAGKDVSQKAKDVSEIAKLKLDIKSKEDYVQKQYEELIANTSKNKVAALTEVGYNPDVKKLEQSHTPWAYYMTWSKEFCMDGVYNTVEKLKEMYDSDYSVKRTR